MDESRGSPRREIAAAGHDLRKKRTRLRIAPDGTGPAIRKSLKRKERAGRSFFEQAGRGGREVGGPPAQPQDRIGSPSRRVKGGALPSGPPCLARLEESARLRKRRRRSREDSSCPEKTALITDQTYTIVHPGDFDFDAL